MSSSNERTSTTTTVTNTASTNANPTVTLNSIEALEALPLKLRTEIEAAAFRRLVAHLQLRTDVQNIDLMDLAGFCRNCLSKWYRAEAEEREVQLEDLTVREHIYGMPYSVWKSDYQR